MLPTTRTSYSHEYLAIPFEQHPMTARAESMYVSMIGRRMTAAALSFPFMVAPHRLSAEWIYMKTR